MVYYIYLMLYYMYDGRQRKVVFILYKYQLDYLLGFIFKLVVGDFVQDLIWLLKIWG